jgi:hypothetical protein
MFDALSPQYLTSPARLLGVTGFRLHQKADGARLSVFAQTIPDRDGLLARILVGHIMMVTTVQLHSSGNSFTAFADMPPLAHVQMDFPGPTVSLELELVNDSGLVLDVVAFGTVACTDTLPTTDVNSFASPQVAMMPTTLFGAPTIQCPFPIHDATIHDTSALLSAGLENTLHAYAPPQAGYSPESAYGPYALPTPSAHHEATLLVSGTSPGSTDSSPDQSSIPLEEPELPYPRPRSLVDFTTVPPRCMTANWTAQELDNGRRLVRFTCERGPSGRTLVACTPVPQAQATRSGLGVIVSCIVRPSTGSHVFTSYDLILLAALLYGVDDLPSDEKSRLRRPMERFNPRSINKKRDYEIFSRVAGFPNPRPLTVRYVPSERELDANTLLSY